MAEIKNTKKKPVAKKPASAVVNSPTEELEKTASEAVVTTEQQTEQAATAKPANKKTPKQATKTTIAEQQEAVAVAEDEKIIEVIEPEKSENATDNSEQPIVADEPKAESRADEQKAAAASAKPAKASGKKLALSKNMIIILSCVLALVIIGVILAVTLTSCQSDNDKMYTVTFVVDGQVMKTEKLSAGDKINEPKNNPTKDMHSFDGWYLVNPNAASQTQRFIFGTSISRNITLVAKFRGETSIKIELNPNGGAFSEDKQVELLGLIGSQMTEPEDEPTRIGYTFGGWYTEAECYNKYVFDEFPIENLTLYAGWARDIENYVFMSYYGNGELLFVDPVQKEENVTLPDLFADNDDIVVGDWFIGDNPNRPYTAGKATEDLDLYINYYTAGLVFTATRVNVTVSGYNGTATEVIVPAKYDGKIVTGIGAYAFYRTSGLPAVTAIKLPDSIVTISEGAFYDCQFITNINLTENVTSIGKDAFYRNIRLRTVGDISGVADEGLGAGAFNGCKELREITLGDYLTKIGDYTFNDCASLTKVVLPDALMEIGEYAFSGCTALTSVDLESLIMDSIADNAFADCSSLAEFNITKTSDVVTIQGNPFVGCRNVTIYVPSALLEEYQNNTNNSQLKDKFAAR